MERRFRRDIGELEKIFSFVSEFLDARGISEDHSFDLDLIIEELFTNMVRHNIDGKQEIAINIDRENEEVVVTLTDFGVEGFDITSAPQVDIHQPVSERRAGGLGIHLVRQIADSLSYDHVNGNSRIQVRKRLES